MINNLSFKDLIDDRVGIINSIKEIKTHLGSPYFFRYCVYMSSTKSFCDQENFRASIGIGITRERAMMKAIGEGIERYSSAIYYKKDLPFCSYQEANFDCIHPNEFVRYPSLFFNDKDFIWKSFNETTKVRWTSIFDVTNKKTTHIPAACVYLPYIYDGEEKILQSISTGLACHTSYEEAALTAILEVVERDAFMIIWRNKISPPKININTLPTYIKNIIEKYHLANQEITLLDITTDIKVPTILAVLCCNIPNNPALILAGSCKLSCELAILSALEELELTRSHCVKLMNSSEPNITSRDQVKNQKDHLLFWSKIENLHLADFLFQSNSIISFNDFPTGSMNSSNEELNYVIKMFANLNLRVLLANITSEDIASYGFNVMRAVIPQLHPLAFGYKNDLFECQRLITVPKKLGYKINSFEENYLLHPFP